MSGWKIDIKSHTQYEAMIADEGSDYQIYEYDRQDMGYDPELTQDPVDDEVWDSRIQYRRTEILRRRRHQTKGCRNRKQQRNPCRKPA